MYYFSFCLSSCLLPQLLLSFPEIDLQPKKVNNPSDVITCLIVFLKSALLYPTPAHDFQFMNVSGAKTKNTFRKYSCEDHHTRKLPMELRNNCVRFEIIMALMMKTSYTGM
jgi:hypothetical protein